MVAQQPPNLLGVGSSPTGRVVRSIGLSVRTLACHAGRTSSTLVYSVYMEGIIMDYRNLLLKYMEYIAETEGTDYTGRVLEFSNLFSNDEKKELRELSKVNSYKDTSKPKIAKRK